jgi:polyisoprenoid-binding protein YceI
MNRCCAAVAALTLLATPLWTLAQQPEKKGDEKPAALSYTGTYDVDGVHSSNVFCIKHMDVANFYGRFSQIEGTFTLDDADATKSAFDIKLKTASVDTANEVRDKHLRSDECFDAEKHPDITFKSKSIKKAGEKALEVTGDLTMKGVTKPLTAKVELTGVGKGFSGGTICGWETTFTVKRSDFDVGKPGGLSDDVRITISVEGVKK